MVERGGLENRCGRKSTEGSNPSLSAIPLQIRSSFCNYYGCSRSGELRLSEFRLFSQVLSWSLRCEHLLDQLLHAQRFRQLCKAVRFAFVT